MAVYFGGTEYREINIAGAQYGALQIAGADYHETDTPGTLQIATETEGANVTNLTFTVSDPDGIRAISSAVMVAGSDGTRSDIASSFALSSGSYVAVSNRRNRKWRSGSITVSYVDAGSGETRTLTGTWDET